MGRITVRLPKDLDRVLTEAAERTHRTRSEIVRRALRRYLDADLKSKPADLVADLLGSVESGVLDLAEDHRRYVVESLLR